MLKLHMVYTLGGINKNILHNGLTSVDTATVLTLLSILDPLLSVDLHHIGQQARNTWIM